MIDNRFRRETLKVQHDPLKRGFDILFSALFLIVFSPVYLAIALIVFVTSPGPVFYRSTRLGRGGKVIKCLKFRTMYPDAEERLHTILKTNPEMKRDWDLYQKFKNDPRIIPTGQFLRRTSLDELPQFWNVLKGDLSVVGPRPPTLMGPPADYLHEIRTIYGKSAFQILSVRPGITGIWQVSGRSEISLLERSKLERHYARCRTFWLDIVVIAKTVPAVFLSKGAY